jgi:GntR family transcriptional regulator
MLNFDKGAPPLYYQVKQIIKEKIENGEYLAGDMVMSEAKFQEIYDISRTTIRQAINELVNEGYLKRVRGKGTVVSYEKVNENINKIISLSEELKMKGISFTTKYCQMTLEKANKQAAQNLKLHEGEEAYKLARLRYVKNSPFVYTVTYLGKKLNLSLNSEEYQNSLYKLLEDKYDIKVSNGKDTFESVGASEEVSKYLGITIGEPILKRTRITYDQYGGIIEYTLCYYRGDRFKYTVEL